MLAGQLATMAFGVTDTIVAGRYSQQSLAALSVGSASCDETAPPSTPSAIWTGAITVESFSGTVVDVMCRGKDLAGHTRDCAVTCSKSGYGLVTADGKFLKFDEQGNVRTLGVLKKAAKDKDLKAKITGALAGDVLKVESIELQ